MKSEEWPLEPHLFDYFQREKIEQLYNQLVEKSEKSFITQKKSQKDLGMGLKAGLGNLLSGLGLDFSTDGNIKNSRSNMEETHFELTAEQKLQKMWKILADSNRIDDLNKCLQKRISPEQTIVLVKFSTNQARFQFVKPPADVPQSTLMINVDCLIEDYDCEFFCSQMYFQDSSLLFDIHNQVTREIRGIAVVKKIEHRNKKVFLNPLAF
jgi:hypothetical protein